jgi:DNA-binding CsgD family transcriptional regulator
MTLVSGDVGAAGLALVERAGELAAITAFARATSGWLVIEGPAGVGKSALLRRLHAMAAEDAVVLRAQAYELSRDVPFGVARRLLDPLVRESPGLLDRGHAQLARPVFTGSDGPGADGTPGPLAEALARLVEDFAAGPGGRRVLIAVDDVQWSDAGSLRFLAVLGRRIEEGRVRVAVTLRTDEPFGTIDLLERNGAIVLRPAPLTPGGVGAVVRATLPDADAALAARVARLTGGNPLLVKEVLATARDIDRLDADELVPETVRRSTLLRLDTVSAAARALAEAVAVLGEAASAQAAEVAELEGTEAGAAAAALVARRLLAPGDAVSFEHPLIGAAVAGSIAPFARARLHRRAASVLAGAGAPEDVVAAHLLHARPDGDAWTVGVLRRSAARAVARGEPGSAARALRRAADEPPAPAERGRVLIELARAEAASGDVSAIERFATALERVAGRHEREEAWHELSRLLWVRGDFGGAHTVARRGRNDVGPDTERLIADELAAAVLVPELAGAAAVETSRLVAAIAAGRPPAEPALLAQVLMHLGWRGLHLDRIPALARAATAADPLVDSGARGVPVMFVAGSLTWVDEIDASADVLDAAIARATELGDPVTVDNLRVNRAWQHYYAGQLHAALALLEDVVLEARAWRVNRALAAAPLAQTRLELGDVPGAQAAIAMGDPSSPGFGWAKGRVELAAGDPRGALATFTADGRMLEEHFGLGNPAIVPWRSEAAIAALRIGDAELARSLAAAELARARELSNPRGLGVALRASGLVAGGPAGLAQLEEAVEALERSQTRIEWLRALVDLGAAQRRAGRRGEASATLERARTFGEQFGAAALTARAGAELALAEPREPEGGLTAAERRSATLASAGRTTREIAHELHVSPRTVESQLASVYRKLGVASRRELAGKLAQG